MPQHSDNSNDILRTSSDSVPTTSPNNMCETLENYINSDNIYNSDNSDSSDNSDNPDNLQSTTDPNSESCITKPTTTGHIGDSLENHKMSDIVYPAVYYDPTHLRISTPEINMDHDNTTTKLSPFAHLVQSLSRRICELNTKYAKLQDELNNKTAEFNIRIVKLDSELRAEKCKNTKYSTLDERITWNEHDIRSNSRKIRWCSFLSLFNVVQMFVFILAIYKFCSTQNYYSGVTTTLLYKVIRNRQPRIV